MEINDSSSGWGAVKGWWDDSSTPWSSTINQWWSLFYPRWSPTTSWASGKEGKVSDPEEIKPFITKFWLVRIVLHTKVSSNGSLHFKNYLTFSNASLCVRRGNGVQGCGCDGRVVVKTWDISPSISDIMSSWVTNAISKSNYTTMKPYVKTKQYWIVLLPSEKTPSAIRV